MLKKLNNKKGFTLMEMLIVVAIIAVLVAIAIPVFNGALTKSKEAADVANVRAQYAEWQVAIITGEKKVADITDEATFLKGPNASSNAISLNYDNLAIDTAKKTLTYTATKLVNEAAGADSHTFTWNLGESDITG